MDECFMVACVYIYYSRHALGITHYLIYNSSFWWQESNLRSERILENSIGDEL